MTEDVQNEQEAKTQEDNPCGLPFEIWMMIFNNLSIENALQLSMASRFLNSLWNNIKEEHFHNHLPDVFSNFPSISRAALEEGTTAEELVQNFYQNTQLKFFSFIPSFVKFNSDSPTKQKQYSLYSLRKDVPPSCSAKVSPVFFKRSDLEAGTVVRYDDNKMVFQTSSSPKKS